MSGVRKRIEPVENRWQDTAPCRAYPVEMFFPERGASADRAKCVCAGCPYKAPCLDLGMTGVLPPGIWGGLSQRERRSRRKQETAALKAEVPA